ncbi:MAG: glycosyltransferase family 4 protein [Patescibacteria group bacterium]|nr:glycosyltransferase family 4 protein [Patescibacteria group bacterium]
MRILITTGIYPPDIGGPATYSKLLFDELPKRGIEVVVLSFGEVRNLPKIIRHIIYFFKILKRAKGVDVIYAQDPVSVGLPTMLANKFLRKKFFIRIAGDYAWEQGVQRFGVKDDLDTFSTRNNYGLKVRFFKKIQFCVVKQADKIIVPSHYFKQVIVNWGIAPEKIKVIYNGIEINELKVHKVHKVESNVLLSVGRLVPWKGFKVLIETMPNILQEIPEVKLVIVGGGPQKEELEETIERLGLQGKVILTGQLTREELLKQKQLADIFVFNTNWESFSFDTVEAMTLGLPVITTNICSLPELIENNVEGILVEPNDKEALKKAIFKVLKNDLFRQGIIQNAYEKSKQFSIQNTLDNLEKLLIEDIFHSELMESKKEFEKGEGLIVANSVEEALKKYEK